MNVSDSNITKLAIAEGFKKLCRTKGFDKISIADITGACGLGRQTFYYHFADKYELLGWIYYRECFELLVEDITLDNWDGQLCRMLEHMQKDASFYKNTIRSQADNFTDYLFGIARTLFTEAIEKLDESGNVGEQDRSFYAEFYAYGCCGVVLSWVKSGMKRPAAEVAHHLKSLALDSEKLGYRLYSMEQENHQ